jgi:hypothetical protein
VDRGCGNGRWRKYTETSNVGVGAVGAGAVEVGDGVEGDPWRGHVRLAGRIECIARWLWFVGRDGASRRREVRRARRYEMSEVKRKMV